MKKLILLLCLNTCIYTASKAQQNVTVESVIGLLKQMRAGYDSIANLSFDVAYTYSKQNTPAEVLDSLSGRMQVSNHRYHWNISNTEMIANDKYVVMLFKEDKLMYITKPAQQTINNLDPFARFDSSLFLMKGLQCSVEKKKNIVNISLHFPDSSSYKQIGLSIDQKTGFMISTLFIIKPEALKQFGDFDSEDLKGGNSCVRIEARYFNYSKEIIEDTVFSEDSYFKKTGTAFTTAEPYNDFKIFIGSPNL